MKSKQLNPAALPPIERAARQEYEYFGSTLTTNTALKAALLCAFLIIGMLSWNTVRLSRIAASVKPLIIRINEVGRAEAIAYQDFTYKPQAPEIRYFLTTFVTGYYSRNHKTVARQYVNSLYFLDRSLFSAIDARDRRTQWLPKFLNSSDDDIDVTVNNVVLEASRLGTDIYRLPVLINRQEITGEDRKIASSYHVGDSVRYSRGSEALGLEAKTYATVIHVDGEHNQITVQRPNGSVVTYDPARVKGVAIYEREVRAFAEGDRIQFTAPWKEKAVSGRDLGTVTYLADHGNVSVKLDDSGRTVAWNLNQNKHVDYVYAMTSHSSQGATVDRALIHIDTRDSRVRALVDETLAYVATSRPRYDAQIFTDDAEQLTAALSRRHENATALSPEQITTYSISV